MGVKEAHNAAADLLRNWSPACGAEHLNPGRHGEWTEASGAGPPAGPRWGVSQLPPGMDAADPRARDIMRRQQLR